MCVCVCVRERERERERQRDRGIERETARQKTERQRDRERENAKQKEGIRTMVRTRARKHNGPWVGMWACGSVRIRGWGACMHRYVSVCAQTKKPCHYLKSWQQD